MAHQSIQAFLLADFALKLSQSFFKRVSRPPASTCTPASLASFLQAAISSPHTDLYSELSNSLGFTSDTLEVISCAYNALRWTESLDKNTAERVDAAFGQLSTMLSPVSLLAGFSTNVSGPDDFSEQTSAFVTEQRSDALLAQVISLPRVVVYSPLRNFSTAKGTKPVKKEYYRCQHIRAMKKAIRTLASQKKLKVGMCPTDKCTPQQTELLEKLEHLANGYDWKSTEKSSAEERSFNNKYCRVFYEDLRVRRFHYQFCDLVFDRCPADLCTNVKVKCCLSTQHTADCTELWTELKEYTKFGMLEELSFCRAELEAEEG